MSITKTDLARVGELVSSASDSLSKLATARSQEGAALKETAKELIEAANLINALLTGD